MFHTLRHTTRFCAGIVLLLAWAWMAPAAEPTIQGDIKNAREVLKTEGSSAPYIEENGPKRLAAWREAAEKGSAEAQWLLSRCYNLGVGVAKDQQEAVSWTRKSADQGFALAQNSLAYFYNHGLGVEQDYSAARVLYMKAAEQNESAAQYNLGKVYADGLGIPADAKEAIKWFARSAETGTPAGCNEIGEFYEFGQGVKEDFKEAAQWYRRGSDLGHGPSTVKLLALLEQGLGVEKDAAEAKRLRELARKQLGEDAEKAILWASVRMVEGTWQLPAMAGDKRFVLTLTLKAEGKGQLYLFQPTKDDDSEGALKVGGLTYKVERQPEGGAIILEKCAFLPEMNAKIAFSVKGAKLRLMEGKAIWSKDDKEGLELKGAWTALETDRPYGGIVVGAGGVINFNSITIEK